ncbi:MAG: ATP-binding protein [Acidobacteria bacterium]|nr:ATP-binding protein [Acidobacteriota bacterium]
MTDAVAASVPAQGDEVTIEIPARPEYLSVVRNVVAATASVDPTFGDDRLDDIRLVVSEAATNAIEAHLAAGNENRIGITVVNHDDHVVVEVVDHGVGFSESDIIEHPSLDSDQRLAYESGLGIPLMKALADETDIVSDGSGGTVVRLVVYPRKRG